MKTVNLSELYRLREMLNRTGYLYEYFEEPVMGGATIKMPNNGEWRRTNKGVSVIQHRSSYGGNDGKLEVWIKPDMKEPKGWLSAEEAFELIRDASDKASGRWKY